MSMLPDCRNDDVYNEDFLSSEGDSEIFGYDYATEKANNFFDNLDVYFDQNSVVGEFLNRELPYETDEVYTRRTFTENGTHEEDIPVKTYGDLIRAKLLEWLEMSRNERIVSMIDNMGDKELDKNRRKALFKNIHSDNPKEYYDTIKYAAKGIKVSRVSAPEEREDDVADVALIKYTAGDTDAVTIPYDDAYRELFIYVLYEFNREAGSFLLDLADPDFDIAEIEVHISRGIEIFEENCHEEGAEDLSLLYCLMAEQYMYDGKQPKSWHLAPIACKKLHELLTEKAYGEMYERKILLTNFEQFIDLTKKGFTSNQGLSCELINPAAV